MRETMFPISLSSCVLLRRWSDMRYRRREVGMPGWRTRPSWAAVTWDFEGRSRVCYVVVSSVSEACLQQVEGGGGEGV